MQVDSKGGGRYMLTFSTAYFIKAKSKVLSKFMEYVNSVEKDTSCHITKLNILSVRQVFQILCQEGNFAQVHCPILSTAKWSC